MSEFQDKLMPKYIKRFDRYLEYEKSKVVTGKWIQHRYQYCDGKPPVGGHTDDATIMFFSKLDDPFNENPLPADVVAVNKLPDFSKKIARVVIDKPKATKKRKKPSVTRLGKGWHPSVKSIRDLIRPYGGDS